MCHFLFPFSVHTLVSRADLWFLEQHRRSCRARQCGSRVRRPQVPGGVPVLARVRLQHETLHPILHHTALRIRRVPEFRERRGRRTLHAHRYCLYIHVHAGITRGDSWLGVGVRCYRHSATRFGACEMVDSYPRHKQSIRYRRTKHTEMDL